MCGLIPLLSGERGLMRMDYRILAGVGIMVVVAALSLGLVFLKCHCALYFPFSPSSCRVEAMPTFKEGEGCMVRSWILNGEHTVKIFFLKSLKQPSKSHSMSELSRCWLIVTCSQRCELAAQGHRRSQHTAFVPAEIIYICMSNVKMRVGRGASAWVTHHSHPLTPHRL